MNSESQMYDFMETITFDTTVCTKLIYSMYEQQV